jgi:hypothetical protein
MQIKKILRLIVPAVYAVLFAYYMIATLFVGVMPVLSVCLYILYVVGFLANGLHFVLLLKGRTPEENGALRSVCSFVNFLGLLCAVAGIILLLW